MKYPINKPALFQLIFKRCLDDLDLRDDDKAVFNDNESDDMVALIVLWFIALRSEKTIEDITEDDCKNSISIYEEVYQFIEESGLIIPDREIKDYVKYRHQMAMIDGATELFIKIQKQMEGENSWKKPRQMTDTASTSPTEKWIPAKRY